MPQPPSRFAARNYIFVLICTVFYVGVAIVLTGIQPWQMLRNAAPVANALDAIGLNRVEQWVTVGALTGMISSLLVFQLGQAACVVFDVARRLASPRVLTRSSEIPHSGCRHVGSRNFRRNSGGHL